MVIIVFMQISEAEQCLGQVVRNFIRRHPLPGLRNTQYEQPFPPDRRSALRFYATGGAIGGELIPKTTTTFVYDDRVVNLFQGEYGVRSSNGSSKMPALLIGGVKYTEEQVTNRPDLVILGIRKWDFDKGNTGILVYNPKTETLSLIAPEHDMATRIAARQLEPILRTGRSLDSFAIGLLGRVARGIVGNLDGASNAAAA